MPLRLELKTGDVTLAGEQDDSNGSVPRRVFRIENDPTKGFTLRFDGHQVLVQREHIRNLITKVTEHALCEWQSSRQTEIRSTFAPLNRIVNAINTTPSYHLFLAGFQIAEAIGFFEFDDIAEADIKEAFLGLVGNLIWSGGKKGRLFFLPAGPVSDNSVREELNDNGKIFLVYFSSDTASIEEKLCVPYATPIGFATKVSPDTEEEWRRITKMQRAMK